jgi:hypothetical protein
MVAFWGHQFESWNNYKLTQIMVSHFLSLFTFSAAPAAAFAPFRWGLPQICCCLMVLLYTPVVGPIHNWTGNRYQHTVGTQVLTDNKILSSLNSSCNSAASRMRWAAVEFRCSWYFKFRKKSRAHGNCTRDLLFLGSLNCYQNQKIQWQFRECRNNKF